MGLGNVQGMRVILRNNRQILRKTGLFKKDQSFLSSRKEYLKAAKGEVDFKTISKSELRALREKVIKNRKAETLRVWIITLAIMIPVIFFGAFISNKYTHQKNLKIQEQQKRNNKVEQILVQQKLTEDLNEFNYLIEEGDKWIEKRNWNSAIYRYKQAVELFPNEFEGNYRLALAYSYRCKDENKDCEIGEKITNRLLKYFPNEPGLIELKSVFDK